MTLGQQMELSEHGERIIRDIKHNVFVCKKDDMIDKDQTPPQT